jgi:hypothetical protein
VPPKASAAQAVRRAPRAAHPPAEAGVEERHEERDAGRRVVAHVRAGGGARDAHRGAQAQRVLGAVAQAAVAAAVWRPAVGGLAVAPGDVRPRVQRRERERHPFALVPLRARPAEIVERGVDDREEVRPVARVGPVHPGRPEAMQGEVVGGAERLVAGGVPVGPRRAEERAHEAVAVEGVEREVVDADERRGHGRDEQRDARDGRGDEDRKPSRLLGRPADHRVQAPRQQDDDRDEGEQRGAGRRGAQDDGRARRAVARAAARVPQLLEDVGGERREAAGRREAERRGEPLEGLRPEQDEGREGDRRRAASECAAFSSRVLFRPGGIDGGSERQGDDRVHQPGAERARREEEDGVSRVEPRPGPDEQCVQQRRERDDREQQRGDDRPVEQEVAEVDRQQRPGVWAERAGVGAEVVGEAAQVRDLLGFGRAVAAEGGQAVARRERLADRAEPAAARLVARGAHVPVDPGRQPRADVAAARDRAQVVEARQRARVRQRLENTE